MEVHRSDKLGLPSFLTMKAMPASAKRIPKMTPVTLKDGWDIPSLMARAGFSHIDLLKIDIEGGGTDLLRNADYQSRLL